MDFEFSKDQQLIKKSVRDFLEKECPSDRVRELEADEKGYDPIMWKKMAGLGWMGISFPEQYNGTDGDFIDLMVVMEEIGRKLLPSPFFATVASCSLPILEYGNDEQKGKFLPAIADGNTIWSLAVHEESSGNNFSEINLRASLKGEEYILSGCKLFVQYAHVADWLLVAARTGGGDEDGLTVFIMDAKSPGLSMNLIPTTAHDRQYEVIFEDVKVPEENVLGGVGKGRKIIDFIYQRGAVLKSAEMLGGVEAALEITSDYAKKRVQFGRVIASFQAIHHKLAELFLDVEGLCYIVYKAAWKVSTGSPSDLLISTAKTKANEIYQRTCIQCMLLHGAIGVTREQDIGLYHLRTRAWESSMGNSNLHREKVAVELEHHQPQMLSEQ